MRYVYLVNRTVQTNEKNVVYPGTLGVFASLKKATDHYNVVVADRLRRGFNQHWDTGRSEAPRGSSHVDFRRTYLTYRDTMYREITEEVCIQRWILFTAKQLKRK